MQTASSIQTCGVGATSSASPETRISASGYDDDTSIIVGAATAAKRQAQLSSDLFETLVAQCCFCLLPVTNRIPTTALFSCAFVARRRKRLA